MLSKFLSNGGIIHIGFGNLGDGKNNTVKNKPLSDGDIITFERTAPRPKIGKYAVNYALKADSTEFGSWVAVGNNKKAASGAKDVLPSTGAPIAAALEYSRHSGGAGAPADKPGKALLKVPAGFADTLAGLPDATKSVLGIPPTAADLISVSGVPVRGWGAWAQNKQAKEPWFIREAPQKATDSTNWLPATAPRKISAAGIRKAPNAPNPAKMPANWFYDGGPATPTAKDDKIENLSAGTHKFWIGATAKAPRTASVDVVIAESSNFVPSPNAKIYSGW